MIADPELKFGRPRQRVIIDDVECLFIRQVLKYFEFV